MTVIKGCHVVSTTAAFLKLWDVSAFAGDGGNDVIRRLCKKGAP